MDLPSLSPTVQSLKAQGNESYKKGDFNEANLLYSRAIELATGSSRSELVSVGMDTVEGLFDLLSNRTAALIQIGDFGRAMLDANACIRLRPSSKAYARRGEVYSYLQLYSQASDAYKEATKLATNSEMKSRMIKSWTLIDKNLSTQADPKRGYYGETEKVLDRYDECKAPEKDGLLDLTSSESKLTAAGNYCDATCSFVAAIQCADRDFSRNKEGNIRVSKKSAALELFVYALCAENNVWFSPSTSSDPNYSIVGKVQFLNFLAAEEHNIDRFLSPAHFEEGSATKVVDILDDEAKKFGWKKTRDALRFLLQYIFFEAVLRHTQTEIIAAENGVGWYRYLINIIDAARIKWPNPTTETCGIDTFPASLHLGTYKLLRKLCQSKVVDGSFNEIALRETSEKMISTCESYSFTPNTQEWYLFRVLVLSDANFSFALLGDMKLQRELAQVESQSNILYYDYSTAVQTAKHSRLAYKDLPPDHPDGMMYYFGALSSELKAGGTLTVSHQVFDRCAEAERCYVRSEFWYGKTPRIYVGRKFCLSVLESLQSWLEDRNKFAGKKSSKDEWDYTIKAVPGVYGKKAQALAKLNGVDGSNLKGQISVWWLLIG